jgi:hypothetical protein
VLSPPAGGGRFTRRLQNWDQVIPFLAPGGNPKGDLRDRRVAENESTQGDQYARGSFPNEEAVLELLYVTLERLPGNRRGRYTTGERP